MTLQAQFAGKIAHIGDFRTVAFPTPSAWLPEGSISMWANIIVVLATGAVMIIINRHFNLLRTTSAFFAAYFVFVTACTPGCDGPVRERHRCLR